MCYTFLTQKVDTTANEIECLVTCDLVLQQPHYFVVEEFWFVALMLITPLNITKLMANHSETVSCSFQKIMPKKLERTTVT